MEKLIMPGLLILIAFLILLVSPKHLLDNFRQPIFLIILIIIIATFLSFNKIIGLLLVIVFVAFIFLSRKYYENFHVVEDDNVQKIVEFEDDSLIAELQNDEDNVTGVWSSSPLGKEMGMSKG